MLQKLERKLVRFAIPNLILFLVGGQTAALVLSLASERFLAEIVLAPGLVMRGEVWRLASFVFFPPSFSPTSSISLLLALVGIYVTYLFGQALQARWGDFRFNLYVLVWWLATIAASFAFPHGYATNFMLIYSISFAFAYTFPDFELLLFFVLPVKAKWLGILAAVGLIFTLGKGGAPELAMGGAGVLNFFLFCGPDMLLRVRGQQRRDRVAKEVERVETAVHHECTVCGKTDKSDPDMQFRYCSKCSGRRAYCMDHLRDHEHVLD